MSRERDRNAIIFQNEVLANQEREYLNVLSQFRMGIRERERLLLLLESDMKKFS